MTKKTATSLINLHTGNDYVRTLYSAFRDIIHLLKDHCGPYASNAILPTSTGGINVIDQYTKDGINIVNSLKTSTPLTRHVMRLVSYVGERTDNACHDGTTTAMLLFSSIAAGFLKLELPGHSSVVSPPRLTDIKNHIATSVSDANLAASHLKVLQDSENAFIPNEAYRRYHLRRALEEFITECEDVLKEDVLTVRDFAAMFRTTEDQALWAVAYHQAFIASKGDAELARGVAEVLSSLPVETYGQYNLRTTGLEKDERFVVEHHDFDFEIPGIVVNREDFNHELRTQYRTDNAILVITPNKLIRGTIEVEYLLQLLRSENVNQIINKPLIIITPELNDNELYTLIRLHNINNPNTKIIGMHMQVGDGARIYADALNATAGALPLETVISENEDTSLAFIHGVGVEQRGTRIYIKDLYEKTGEKLHPSYMDRTLSEFYTKTLKELHTYIENSKLQKNVTRGAEQLLSQCVDVYRFMTCQKQVDLLIGGLSHESFSNISVAKDAFGAAISAIEDGVILGGHQRLLAYTLMQLQRHPKPEEGYTRVASTTRELVLTVFAQALIDVLHTIYYAELAPESFAREDLIETGNEFVENYTNMVGLDRRWFYLQSELSQTENDFEINPVFLPNVHGFITGENNVPVLMQPIVGYKEFFKRAREILPKLINTTSLVDTQYTGG